MCGRREQLLKIAQQDDPDARITTRWQDVVEADDVDIVLIATPDALHHQAVLACAKAGKHVICEKPIGMNADEAKQIRDVIANANLAHFVPFWTRYSPLIQRCREHVRSGLLGRLRAIVFRWHNPRPAGTPHTWRDDATLSAAGSVADIGSHAYDCLCWLTGLEAERVLTHAAIIDEERLDVGDVNLTEALQWPAEIGPSSAVRSDVGETRRATAVNYANLSIVFPGGVVGVIIVSHDSCIRRTATPDLELHGSDASLVVDRQLGTISVIQGNGEATELDRMQIQPWSDRFGRYVFPAFRRALDGQTPDWPNLDDGYRVQVFTDAAMTSARTGGWVDVRTDD
jgi:predicted dehydrogenase